MKMDTKANCPFCSPDRDDAKFSESENFLAIYNIAPILPGHSLVIPRRHIESLFEFNKNELCELMIFSRDTMQVLLKVFKGSGFDWTIQEGEDAGQSVPHLHMHLIPRKPKDLPDPGDWYPLMQESESELIDSASRSRLSADEMKRIASKIRELAAAGE